jgi:transmembrane sensor
VNAARIEEQAAQWLMRRGEPDWSSSDQDALDAWLDHSMAHKAAFWRIEHGWAAADRLAAIGADDNSRSGWRWRNAAWFALAASLLLAIGLVTIPWSSSADSSAQPQRYASRTGERRAIQLADGSRVELNTRTRLRAAVTRAGREIWLDDGEAYFAVAHDADRPFVVHAGPRTITVLGTKFSVRLSGRRVQVAVSEGRVRIDQADSAGRSTTITRGDMAVAEGPSLLVAQNSIQRVEDNLSWRRGMLVFAQSSLGEAAAEFNRYNQRQIRITDPEAARIRIGGSFQADNVDAFGRLLRDAYGLDVAFSPTEIRISS